MNATTARPEIIGEVYLTTYSHQPHTNDLHCAAGCGTAMSTKTHGFSGLRAFEDADGNLYCSPACAYPNRRPRSGGVKAARALEPSTGERTMRNDEAAVVWSGPAYTAGRVGAWLDREKGVPNLVSSPWGQPAEIAVLPRYAKRARTALREHASAGVVEAL